MKNREYFAKILLEHQIKPSYPRLCIYAYLAETTSHPTADDIYSVLSQEMPTLSKMTVYNTLAILMDRGLARLISIEEHEARYDANVDLHGHFKCTDCGRVYDFEVKDDDLRLKGLEAFAINEKDVFLRGICPNCR